MHYEVGQAVAHSSSNVTTKHVDVLLKTSALCREMAGTVGIMCKSGKDRTAMSSTLEITRALVEELGANNGKTICHNLRIHGVRRMNVWANTGQTKFAFNNFQKSLLPACYRPPVGTHTGKVHS